MSNLIFALLAILASVTIAPPVQATTISLVPHPPKVHVPPPASVSVDIMISDLPAVLAAFDVEVVYDFCPLTFGFTCDYLIPTAGGSLGDRLGNPNPAENEIVVDASTVDGIFRLIEVSLLDATELTTLQTDPTTGNLLDSFRQATLNFIVPSGPPSGFSEIPLYFGNVTLSDPDGNSIEPVTVVDTSIIVSEPATVGILLFGLIGLMFSAPHRLLISFIIALGATYSLLGYVASAQVPDPYPHTGYGYIDYCCQSDAQIDEILGLLVHNNIKYIHGQIIWRDVENFQDYDAIWPDAVWSSYDKFFTKLARNNIKIYLMLGSGVDGQISEMPYFLFHQWSQDLGRGGNTLTWDPNTNDVSFHFSGVSTLMSDNWVWLNWEPQYARSLDIQKTDNVTYTISAKGKPGERICVGYNIVSKLDNVWQGSSDTECSYEFKGNDWETFSCTMPFNKPLKPDEYLQFKIGVYSGVYSS